MCGSGFSRLQRSETDLFLKFRVLSYTAMGILFGYFGRVLSQSLELEVVRGFAFFAFVFLTVIFVLPELVPGLPQLRIGRLAIQTRLPAKIKGLCMGLLPCHLLGFNYSLAALSQSAVAGGLLLFGHAVVTTPALSLSRVALQSIEKHSKVLKVFLRLAVAVSIGFTFYTFSRTFSEKATPNDSPLMCLPP